MLRTLDNHTYTAPSCSSIDLQSQTKIDPKSKIISLSPRRYDLALDVTGSSVIDPHKLNGTCLLVPLHNLVMMIRWPLTFNPPKDVENQSRFNNSFRCCRAIPCHAKSWGRKNLALIKPAPTSIGEFVLFILIPASFYGPIL